MTKTLSQFIPLIQLNVSIDWSCKSKLTGHVLDCVDEIMEDDDEDYFEEEYMEDNAEVYVRFSPLNMEVLC